MSNTSNRFFLSSFPQPQLRAPSVTNESFSMNLKSSSAAIATKPAAENPPPPYSQNKESRIPTVVVSASSDSDCLSTDSDSSSDSEFSHYIESLSTMEEELQLLDFLRMGSLTLEDNFGVHNNDPLAAAEVHAQHGPVVRSVNKGPRHKSEYYVVFRGVIPGVYASWAGANYQTSGVSHNVVQKFSTYAEACDEYDTAVSNGTGGIVLPLPLNQNLPPPSKPSDHCIYPSLPLQHSNPSAPVASQTKLNKDQPLQALKKGKGHLKAKENTHHDTTPVSPTPLGATSSATSTSQSFLTPQIAVNYELLADEHRYSYKRIPARSDTALYDANRPKIYVVIQGQFPGIYYGHEAATKAIGDAPYPVVVKVGSAEQGYKVLTDAVMMGNLISYVFTN